MLVIGTSGQVYPAAGLAFGAHQRGSRVVVINPESTELDRIAEACMREPSAHCLPYLLESP
jgi:NAD-dependent deacetylase